MKKQLNKQIRTQGTLQDFKLSLDIIQEAVLMFDADDLELFYFNLGAQNMLGLSQWQSKLPSLPELIVENERVDFYTILGPLYRQEQRSAALETVFLTTNKRTFPAEIQMFYVLPRKGEDRFVVVVRDVSERKTAEQEQQMVLTRQLHSLKLESVGNLAAGIAHEINTPSQFVLTNLVFLEESFNDVIEVINSLGKNNEKGSVTSDELTTALARADWPYLREEIPLALKQSREGMSKISSIVLAMKEFSSSNTKGKHPENLNKIIETTVTVSRNEWKYVAELTTDLDKNIPEVPCLRDGLGQVFLNLIANAVQAIEDNNATKDGEFEKGSIVVSSRNVENNIEIRVIDSGSGIPAEIQNRIFDPFFTTRDVGKGVGLGLAMCRDVIEQRHGGKLSFVTEKGVGTTFIIRIPVSLES